MDLGSLAVKGRMLCLRACVMIRLDKGVILIGFSNARGVVLCEWVIFDDENVMKGVVAFVFL